MVIGEVGRLGITSERSVLKLADRERDCEEAEDARLNGRSLFPTIVRRRDGELECRAGEDCLVAASYEMLSTDLGAPCSKLKRLFRCDGFPEFEILPSLSEA